MKYCICQNKKPLKRQLITRRYRAGGFENIELIGVEFYRCPECEEVFYGYHDIEQLHSVILELHEDGLLPRKETLRVKQSESGEWKTAGTRK